MVWGWAPSISKSMGLGARTKLEGLQLLAWEDHARIGHNVSLTPFLNGFAVRSSNDDANVGQIGLSITFH